VTLRSYTSWGQLIPSSIASPSQPIDESRDRERESEWRHSVYQSVVWCLGPATSEWGLYSKQQKTAKTPNQIHIGKASLCEIVHFKFISISIPALIRFWLIPFVAFICHNKQKSKFDLLHCLTCFDTLLCTILSRLFLKILAKNQQVDSKLNDLLWPLNNPRERHPLNNPMGSPINRRFLLLVTPIWRMSISIAMDAAQCAHVCSAHSLWNTQICQVSVCTVTWSYDESEIGDATWMWTLH